MLQLNELLKTRLDPSLSSKKRMSHEWQAFAYKTWIDYSGDKKELPNLIRLFKQHHLTSRAFLDNAYNFCVDYEGNIPKLKLFYWRFWQLKKGKVI